MRNSKQTKKLALSTQTVRALDADKLALVAGGTSGSRTCKYQISVGLCD